MLSINKDKCKLLYFERKSTGCIYKIGNSWLGTITSEKDMGVVLVNKLHVNQP